MSKLLLNWDGLVRLSKTFLVLPPPLCVLLTVISVCMLLSEWTNVDSHRAIIQMTVFVQSHWLWVWFPSSGLVVPLVFNSTQTVSRNLRLLFLMCCILIIFSIRLEDRRWRCHWPSIFPIFRIHPRKHHSDWHWVRIFRTTINHCHDRLMDGRRRSVSLSCSMICSSRPSIWQLATLLIRLSHMTPSSR